MSYDANALKRELIRDEGIRITPYRDSLGYWTVGIGHLLVGDEREKFVNVKTGKPLRKLSEAELEEFFLRDVTEAEINLGRIIPGWRDLDDVRQRALLNLSFNLGPSLGKFLLFLGHVKHGRWEQAAKQLEKSLWWKQVKSRGPRIAHMIATGTAWEDRHV